MFQVFNRLFELIGKDIMSYISKIAVSRPDDIVVWIKLWCNTMISNDYNSIGCVIYGVIKLPDSFHFKISYGITKNKPF